MRQEINCLIILYFLISLGSKDKNYGMNLLFVYGYKKREYLEHCFIQVT